MSRFTTLAAVIALGLGVSACAPAPTGVLSAANNPSLSSVHQPVVQRTDYVLDLSAEGGQLSQNEVRRLHSWLASIDAGYGDRLAIDEAPGYESPAARDTVARIGADYGLALDDGAPVLGGEVPPGSIRVIASRTTASVPGCPDWTGTGEAASVNTSANFGCSINSNLAAMVANPEDLVHGQDGSSAGSGTTASRAVRTYRERQPTGRQGLPATSPTQGDQ